MNFSYKEKKIFILGLLVILYGILWVLAVNYFCEGTDCFQWPWSKSLTLQNQIKSFEQCAAEGYPVSQTFPAECKVGREVFAQTIQKPPSPNSEIDRLRIVNPSPHQLIANPLEIIGQAKGDWYFEASFPIKLLDANNNEVAHITAQAQGDWTTSNFVPFTAKLKFNKPTTSTGTLIFQRDNPSGLIKQAEIVTVPVRFE